MAGLAKIFVALSQKDKVDYVKKIPSKRGAPTKLK